MRTGMVLSLLCTVYLSAMDQPLFSNQENKDKSLYEVLGISRDASSGDIRTAYRRRARTLHPDKNLNDNTTPQFQELQKAYEILSDPTKRAFYDQQNIGCFSFIYFVPQWLTGKTKEKYS